MMTPDSSATRSHGISSISTAGMDPIIPQVHQLMADLVLQMEATEKSDNLAPFQNSQSGTVPDTFASIDQELGILAKVRDGVTAAVQAYFQNRMFVLTTCRNRLAPIYRLPNEIYLVIFELAHAATLEQKGGPAKAEARSFTARNISQVSRLWRQIAIKAPQLWTAIDIPNPVLVDAHASRSAHLPLNLRFQHFGRSSPSAGGSLTPYEKKVQECMGSFILHAGRVQSIVLKDVQPGVFKPLLSTAVPQLRRLDLSMDHEVAAPPKPFTRKFPLLRHLQLHKVYISLTSSLYADLTALELDKITFPEPVHHFIRALSACPMLRSLYLISVIFTSSMEAPDVVDLPRLKNIEFHGLRSCEWSTILASIRPSPALRLAGRYPIWREEDLSALLPRPEVLSANLTGLLASEELCFSFPIKSEKLPYTFRLDVSSGKPHGSNLDLTFHPHWDSNFWDFSRRVFFSVGSALPLPGLKKLALVDLGDSIMKTPDFVTVIRRFPELREIRLDKCAPKFVAALGTMVLLPDLRSLSLS
ncbi:hypothetical protein BOTBODRAFT_35896, partial [Botryobasidium botryosum FD-172 SS1]